MRTVLIALVALGMGGGFTHATAQDAQTQLWDAAIRGDTVAIREAIRGGANVNALDVGRSRNGRRALNYAALTNQVGAIRVLLAAGAAIDSENLTGFTPLHHAAERGSLEAAQALVDAGADARRLNERGETPATVAYANGFPKVGELLEAAERRKQSDKK